MTDPLWVTSPSRGGARARGSLYTLPKFFVRATAVWGGGPRVGSPGSATLEGDSAVLGRVEDALKKKKNLGGAGYSPRDSFSTPRGVTVRPADYDTKPKARNAIDRAL